jgi:hypothetical protein
MRLIVGVILVLGFLPLAAGPPSPNEYALKAVFLYNFVRFIDWPESAFASSAAPLVIGIVGEDPFGSLLGEAIAGETYHGRPIQIEHYNGGRDLRRCHILFVSQSAAAQLPQILGAVAGKNVVTVGETDYFLNRGGMIALTAGQNRVRLRINSTALRNARLNVSSKLLQVAEIRS